MLGNVPRPVWVLQLGNVVNTFGFGLVLPFEIIYLHEQRGFSKTTAGLVLSAAWIGAIAASPIAGGMIDRAGARPVLVAGSLLSATGYAALAFVDAPWQAFAASVVAGTGTGCSAGAGPALLAGLVSGRDRTSAFALGRVALNLGIGLGALVGGFVAAGGGLHSFQALYLLDAATFVVFSSIVLLLVPAARAPRPAEKPRLAVVLRDRPFVALVSANVVFIATGFTLFGNILPPYARQETAVTERGIGIVFLVNTAFIILAQLPLARVAGRMRRTTALGLMSALWASACLGVLLAARPDSAAAATAVLAAVGIVFALGECLHAVVIGPAVADLAPPHMVGRYMSTLGLSMSVGFALGPALGAAMLTATPTGLWVAAAVAVGVTGLAVRGLEGSIPEHAQLTPQPEGAT